MSTNFTAVLIVFSMIVWMMVSSEAVKSSEKVNWRKMIMLLSAGTLSTLILIIPLFKNFPI